MPDTHHKDAEESRGNDAADPAPAANPTNLFDAATAALDAHKNYSDVALAGLCQSYAHALSMAFQEAVLNQQRRSAIAQAAVAAALARIEKLEGGALKDHLAEVREGLEMFGLSENEDMAAFTGITNQFQVAADRLLDVRKQAGLD